VAVSVGVDVFGVSVAVAVASGNFVGSVVAVITPPRFMVGEGTPAGYGCPEPCDGCG
jgi:fructose-1,6-bisphosphatase/inositol monophosphatase family enzyme